MKNIGKQNKRGSFTRRLADPGLMLFRLKCRMKRVLSVNARFDPLPYLNVVPTWILRGMACRAVTNFTNASIVSQDPIVIEVAVFGNVMP